MANGHFGETMISPQELYKLSNSASRFHQIVVNLIILGVACLIGWVTIPPIMQYFGLFASGVSEVAEHVQQAAPEGYVFVPSPRLIITIISFMFFIVLILKTIYKFAVVPFAKTFFYRTSANRNAVASANAGLVKYKIDQYGLEYDIESSKARNRYKLYWRNFTDVEYAPDIIRLYEGKKQTAFILMRAFKGNERIVGQYVETEMNKVLAKAKS